MLPKNTKQNNVSYGKLNIDQGETFELAQKQIDSFAPHQPLAFYFDVVGGPDQSEVGRKLAEQIKAYAAVKMPHLGGGNLVCEYSVR